MAEETAIIFGRVSPHQEKSLSKLLKKQGIQIWAMTKMAGSRRPLAREADCSIVMAEGDPATNRLLIWFS